MKHPSYTKAKNEYLGTSTTEPKTPGVREAHKTEMRAFNTRLKSLMESKGISN